MRLTPKAKLSLVNKAVLSFKDISPSSRREFNSSTFYKNLEEQLYGTMSIDKIHQLLQKILKIQNFKKGDIILREDQCPYFLTYILEGMVSETSNTSHKSTTIASLMEIPEQTPKQNFNQLEI